MYPSPTVAVIDGGALLQLSRRDMGDVVVLELSGELAADDAGESLHTEVKRLLEEGHQKILLNMKEVSWINSSGLGILTSSFASVRRSGGRIKIAHLSPRVRSIIAITKLASVLDIHATEADAMAGFHETAGDV